jgi:hypothetical protein
MKLKFVYKGGPGSGFRGHAGRPGEVGGSSSNSLGITVNPKKEVLANKFYAALGTNKEAYNIAIGLMADGEFPDFMNLNNGIDMNEGTEWLDPDDETAISYNFEDMKFSPQAQEIISNMQKDYDIARYSKGWDRYKKNDKARLVWETQYYGRTFADDHEEAEGWAIEYIDDFINKL